MTEHHSLSKPRTLSRRRFIGVGAASIAACSGILRPSEVFGAAAPRAGQFGQLDATATGGINLHLHKQAILVAGQLHPAITINGSIPGPVIRMTEGKEALIRVHNHLDEDSSIHWHGLILPYTMDGVPGISFEGIKPGQVFTYRYPVRQNGSYWYHSHSGMQEQRGHYGQLIIEPASPDPVQYDVDHSVVLSDWTFEDPHVVMRKLKTMEGYYNFQRPTVANLDDQMQRTGKSLGEVLSMRLNWQRMRMDPTDLADVTGATYAFLMNGQTASENPTLTAEPSQRVRLRLVNASALTFYDFRIPGVPMTVVQADGQNVKPVETDEIRLGVAETYDVVVTMPDRPVTLFAEAMDRSGFARGTLGSAEGLAAEVPNQRPRAMLGMEDMGMAHTAGGHDMSGAGHDQMKKKDDHKAAGAHDHGATGATLPTTELPQRIMHGPDTHGPGSITMAMSAYRQTDDPGVGLGDDGRRVLTYDQLKCLTTPEDRRPPTREIDMHLTGNMHKYIWGMDGKKWSESDMILFQYGERLRLNFINDTMMTHPMHLHGMWMDLYTGGDYADNPRMHTVRVQPAELLTVDITADAPGQWAFHCHVLYHMDMGMFRTVAVVRSLEEGPIHAEL